MDMTTWEKQEVVRLLKGAPGTQYQETDDAGKVIIREWVKSLLQKSTITVTFVKADGTDREMLCTLNSDYIPVDKMPKAAPTGSINGFVDGFVFVNGFDYVDGVVTESKARKEPDPHSLRVFDLEKQEWRSFRFDRLKKITAELNFE